MRKPLPLAERYWRLTETGPGCWLWRGNRNQAGYGQFRVGRKGPVMTAHRVAWEVHNGPIPPGLIVMHQCDNPSCVNPAHLRLGTHKDNSQDMLAKGRNAKHYKPHTRVRKLTDDQVRAIRKDERTAHAIAADYGICETHATAVRARRRKCLVLD